MDVDCNSVFKYGNKSSCWNHEGNSTNCKHQHKHKLYRCGSSLMCVQKCGATLTYPRKWVNSSISRGCVLCGWNITSKSRALSKAGNGAFKTCCHFPRCVHNLSFSTCYWNICGNCSTDDVKGITFFFFLLFCVVLFCFALLVDYQQEHILNKLMSNV